MFMGPTLDPPGSCRPQMGPILAPWTLLSGILCHPQWNNSFPIIQTPKIPLVLPILWNGAIWRTSRCHSTMLYFLTLIISISLTRIVMLTILQKTNIALIIILWLAYLLRNCLNLLKILLFFLKINLDPHSSGQQTYFSLVDKQRGWYSREPKPIAKDLFRYCSHKRWLNTAHTTSRFQIVFLIHP